MSLNEILIAALWIIVGFWICYKRKWYKKFDGDDDFPQIFVIALVVFASPLCLVIAFVREMLIDNWNND